MISSFSTSAVSTAANCGSESSSRRSTPVISAPRLTPTRRAVTPARCDMTGRATLGLTRSFMMPSLDDTPDFCELSAHTQVYATAHTIAVTAGFWQPIAHHAVGEDNHELDRDLEMACRPVGGRAGVVTERQCRTGAAVRDEARLFRRRPARHV